MRPGLSALALAMLALAIAALAVASVAGGAERTQPVAVGEEAPDFTLPDHQGRPFRLSEAVRQRDFVVLAFYVKAFTGGWELEFSRFREDAPKFNGLGAEIIGISSDPPERNRAWAQALKLPFRLLSDTGGPVGRLYGVWDDTWNLERRVTFVIDRARRVRYVEIGSLAIETNRTLEALTKLAKAK